MQAKVELYPTNRWFQKLLAPPIEPMSYLRKHSLRSELQQEQEHQTVKTKKAPLREGPDELHASLSFHYAISWRFLDRLLKKDTLNIEELFQKMESLGPEFG